MPTASCGTDIRFSCGRAKRMWSRRAETRLTRGLTPGRRGSLFLELEEQIARLHLLSDGGDKARAAKRPVVGRDKVARFLMAILPSAPPNAVVAVRTVNGGPGIVIRADGHPVLVVTLDCVDDAIAGIHLIVNPDKLHAVG